ncbi:RagB/SusD family nutrient uptake outer membrane protein [Sphingobacterium spiritivorum]|nr:RagB/SusD family nutrient uptake outer membrane protein [Sphingobacterium spiritivorum]
MKKITYIILLATSMWATSCEKMLEVDPRQSIDASTALTSPEAITAATNGVYAKLRQVSLYGRDLIAIPELLADNAINTGAGNRLIKESNNEIGAHITNWQQSYYAVNQINLILEALENIDLEANFKNNIKGQNLFLRALLYHNLLRVYAYDPTAIVAASDRGGVPIVLKGVLEVDQIEFASRNTIEEGYKQVYQDLTEAATLIAESNNSKAPAFASRGAVAALFSRVALYKGDYEKAVAEADKAMASGVATFPANAQLISSWRSEKHPESFFEVAFTTADNLGSNESLRATFMTRTTVTSNATASFGNVVVSDDLYAQYSANDTRRGLIMKGLGANATRNEMTKFASKNGVANLDNVPVIRYAEVLLNKAEALANLGKDSDARTALNRIRTRANLAEVSLSGTALMEEIILQRRLELAFEGHRFFDIKRRGKDIIKDAGNVMFNDFRILGRLPIREIEINPNLIQNPGY